MKNRKQKPRTAESFPSACPKCGTNTAAAPITDRGWASLTPPVYLTVATCTCGMRMGNYLVRGGTTPAEASCFNWKQLAWQQKTTFTQPVIDAVLSGVVAPRSLLVECEDKRDGDRLVFRGSAGGRTVTLWRWEGWPFCVDVWDGEPDGTRAPAFEYEYPVRLPDDEGELAVLAQLFLSASEAALRTQFRGLVIHPSTPTAVQ